MKSTNQTAYSSQRKARLKSTTLFPGWDPNIANLFNLGHNFLGFEYSDPGWLYRGGTSGLKDILRTGEMGYFDGEQPVIQLEQELEIYLISQDFSDAYSVARFWEGTRDSYIAVFKSSCFNRLLHSGRAAVLGFAEPGVVFKYPFLTRPLGVTDIDFLIVSPEDHERLRAAQADQSSGAYRDMIDDGPLRENLVALETKIISPRIYPETAKHRGVFEKALTTLIESRGIESAVALPSQLFPKAG